MTEAAPAGMGVLEGPVHRLGLRVYFEDTDTAGIVYHARYLAFFERGRAEFLRAAGIIHAAAWLDLPDHDRLGFAVTRCEMDFRAPARLDDWLEIRTVIEASRAATIHVRQTASREGRELVSAAIHVAALDGRGRPRRMPADWRQKLAALTLGAEQRTSEGERP